MSRDEWLAAAREHQLRAERELADVAERRRRGEYHPVEDFLFTYYRLRPRHLLQWQPGVHRRLLDAESSWPDDPDYLVRDGAVEVNAARIVDRRRSTLEFIQRLLRGINSRRAQFGCFGMHEWAMVYGLEPDQTRHSQLPLRYTSSEIREIVDQSGLRCTHFDAFRFFTDEAAPKNTTWISRDDQVRLDQPGCLHVSMDLYKWAGKLGALVPSELLFDCYLLARDVRELDMQASAYDLSEWGYPAVAVETAAGRAEYVERQRGFSERAEPLRQQILAIVDDVLTSSSQDTDLP